MNKRLMSLVSKLMDEMKEKLLENLAEVCLAYDNRHGVTGLCQEKEEEEPTVGEQNDLSYSTARLSVG